MKERNQAKAIQRPKQASEAVKADGDKVARDTARYEALAREHGADLTEEGFNEALKKVSRHTPSAKPKRASTEATKPKQKD